MAIKTFKESIIVSLVLFGALTISMYLYFRDILEILTNIERIHDLAFDLRIWVMINIPGDALACMIRGAIKALGLQKRIILVHVYGQGILGMILTYYFGFHLEMGLVGIWMAKTCVIYFVISYYLVILYQTDWFEIILIAHKKQSKKTDLISD